MIARAKEFESGASAGSSPIDYTVEDLEKVTFKDQREIESYHLVYSSLAFHYVEDLARLYREIHTSLKRSGKLVFSVEHPVSSGPIHPGPEWETLESDGKERTIWPLNSYSEEGWRTTSWLGVEGVRKYHRTLETYVKILLESGFKLTGLIEWSPSLEDIAEHPDWAHQRHRPFFLTHFRREAMTGRVKYDFQCDSFNLLYLSVTVNPRKPGSFR
ncbi:hypothetical protein N7468_000371 [Penicillium chermesinum]|uniref:Methyltransferase type 11 domain-containing protein n=1 Tax=Penicillium chermesinum TaxID=63820 RepID=A0A9W9PM47_9EURO|nr:uncharacterized protein N7468_000371 [Penicillium chermesinum]KAJ5248920.1 hypothetical protein N7468_000371 [Penicillium chermesinum]KAJ6151022.1 hypothetical protein N7470_007616 [Penicillium chermesinum]